VEVIRPAEVAAILPVAAAVVVAAVAVIPVAEAVTAAAEEGKIMYNVLINN